MKLADFGAQLMCLIASNVFGETEVASEFERELIALAASAFPGDSQHPPPQKVIREKFETLLNNFKTTPFTGNREQMLQRLSELDIGRLAFPPARCLLQVLIATFNQQQQPEPTCLSPRIFDSIFPSTERRSETPKGEAPEAETTEAGATATQWPRRPPSMPFGFILGGVTFTNNSNSTTPNSSQNGSGELSIGEIARRLSC